MHRLRSPWLRSGRILHRRLIYPFLAFALPSRCFGCGEMLGPLQRQGACCRCWARLELLAQPLCPTCSLPRPPTTDLFGPARGRCAACVLDPPATDRVVAVVAYEPLARTFLLRAKRGGRPDVLDVLGRMVLACLQATGFAEGCTSVVPVPSHARASLRRGFVPALELARPVARALRIPFARRALRRRWTAAPSLKRLGRRARRLAVSGALTVTGRQDGQRILLVDDVMTTGATIGACASALKAAGAREVRAIAWARALPSRRGFDRFPTDGS